jgi:hypothetical protein
MQLNTSDANCPKKLVADTLRVDVEDIDLYCDPDGWFHERINRHIRLKNFCGCEGEFNHDVYCTVHSEVEVENNLDCEGLPLPPPSLRLIEIREKRMQEQRQKEKVKERLEEAEKAEESNKHEQSKKHLEEQDEKRMKILKAEEQEEKRRVKYEEEEKKYIAEVMDNDPNAQVAKFLEGDHLDDAPTDSNGVQSVAETQDSMEIKKNLERLETEDGL